jgi:hypothetical protein
MAAVALSFTAGGNIAPRRFVKLHSAAHQVVQAVANDRAIGVSQEGSGSTPIPGASTLAATAGNPVRVYQIGETCELEVAAATAVNAYLKPDANGMGVAVAAANYASAQALTSTAAAGICLVRIIDHTTVA